MRSKKKHKKNIATSDFWNVRNSSLPKPPPDPRNGPKGLIDMSSKGLLGLSTTTDNPLIHSLKPLRLAGQNSVGIPSLNFHEPLATHAFVAFFRSINLFETSVFRFPEYFGGAHSACIFLAATLGFRAKTRLLAFFIPGVLNVFKALSHMSTRHTSKPSDFFFGKGRHHCD